MKVNESFKNRQKFKQEFNELFEVLFRIPDKDLHSRVVNAINNTSYCVYCRKKAIISRDSFVQTDSCISTESEDSVSPSSTDRIIHFKSYKTQGLRRRKRTKKGPEVVQSAQLKLTYPQVKRKTQDPIAPRLKARRLSTGSLSSLDSNLYISAQLDEIIMPEELSEEQIKIKMIEEFHKCLDYNLDGLLPIQEALKYKDSKGFQRQLFVLTFKKININDLYTNDDSQLNLIELAVKSKCPLFFFEKLLENGMSMEDVDDDGNTVVNLICKWMEDSSEDVLKFMISKVELEVLKIGNLEGMTPIHHCVVRNSYKMLKILLDFVDEKLGIPSIPNYLNHKLETEQDFFAFYKLAYNAINHRITSTNRDNMNQKMKLLNMREMKSGRTPLFVGAHLQNQHICLMLLNHYASPDVKDHSSIDVITFRHSEGIVDEKTKYMDDVFLNVSLVLAKHKFIFK